MAAKERSEGTNSDARSIISNLQDLILKPNLIADKDCDEDNGQQYYEEYFDIMLIGKTGVGKSTTADKLLLANPTGKVNSLCQDDTNRTINSSQQSLTVTQKKKKLLKHIARIEDLYMWHISDEQGDIDMVEKRLKNLVYCRLTRSPHDEVNRLREESTATKCCELLSNDTSKIRILDVPGFFRSELTPTKNVIKHAHAIVSNHLQVMRKILCIKSVYHFKFNRIVYFLPEQGVLRRNSQILQMELQTMKPWRPTSGAPYLNAWL